MLGKLMKYELKACGRIFVPLYIAILVVAAIIGLFGNTQSFQIPAILIFVLTALFIGLTVVTIVLIIQRFKKNLLEDEGYLMFTLPVSVKSLILSKYLTSLIYIILSVIVSILAFVIILLFGGNLDISIFVNSEFWSGISEILSQKDFVLSIIMMIISGFLAYTMFIFNVYISLSIGQLPRFNKNRTLFGVITFFIINIVIGIVQSTIQGIFISNTYENVVDVYSILSVFNLYAIVSILINIVIIAVLFVGSNWILNKKLNLE